MNMNHQPPPSSDERLRALLRESRPVADPPPGFRNAVWRRIERAELAGQPAALAPWLDRVAAWLVRPRLALASAVALVLLGASFGARDGISLSDQAAQARYLAAVSPLTTSP